MIFMVLVRVLLMKITVMVTLIMAFAIIRFGSLNIPLLFKTFLFLYLCIFTTISTVHLVDDYCSTMSKAFCNRRASNGGVKAANNEEALHSSVKWVFLPQFDYHKAFDF